MTTEKGQHSQPFRVPFQLLRFPAAEISNVCPTLATEKSHTLTHFQTRERRIKERDYFFMGLGLCPLSSNLTQNRPLHSTFRKICGAGVPETLLIFHLADLLLWFRVCLGLIQSLQGKNRECLLWAFKSEQCARSQTLVAVTDVLARKQKFRPFSQRCGSLTLFM